MLTPPSTEFTLKYDGDENSIDALALVNSLMGIVAVIEEVNRAADPEKKIEIRIKALAGGSFDVHVKLIETIIRTLLSHGVVGYTGSIIGSVVGLFKIRQFLKDKAAKNVEPVDNETIKLENSSGNTIIVDKGTYNTYIQYPVERGLDQTFTALQSSPEITNFQILDKEEKQLFIAEKQEFPVLVTNGIAEVTPPPKQRNVTREDRLSIVKPSFDPKLKWEVILGSLGSRIAVKITDVDFLDRVKLRTDVFGAGDVLEVDMDISQTWDETAKAYVSKEYVIVNVKNHTPGPVQIPLLRESSETTPENLSEE